MADKDTGKIIRRPYLFYTLIAIPIGVLNVINALFFDFGAIAYVVLTLIGFYLGKTTYFKYFNDEKKA